jgi:hypothetical protein
MIITKKMITMWYNNDNNGNNNDNYNDNNNNDKNEIYFKKLQWHRADKNQSSYVCIQEIHIHTLWLLLPPRCPPKHYLSHQYLLEWKYMLI